MSAETCVLALLFTGGLALADAGSAQRAAALRLFGVSIGGPEDGFSMTDRSKFESAKRYGARFIELRPFWSTLEPRSGEFDWSTLDAALANAAAVGLPVTITMRFFDNQIPAWLPDENMLDQEGRICFAYRGERSRSISYWAPQGRAAYLRLVEALVLRYRANPAILAWQFFYGYNDAFFWGPYKDRESIYDYSRFSQEKYREYLASETKLSLAGLNARYGVSYLKWEEVVQPKPVFGGLNVTRAWHDFQDYRAWTIERMFDDIDRTVRRLDSRPLIMWFGGTLPQSAHLMNVYDIGLRLLKKYGGMLDNTCFEDPPSAETGAGFAHRHGIPLTVEAAQVPPSLPRFRRLFFHAFSLGVQGYTMVGNWEKMQTSPEEFARTGRVFLEMAEAKPVRAPVAGLASYRTILSFVPAQKYMGPTLALIPRLQERQYSLDWHSDLSPLDGLDRYPSLLDANSEVLSRAVIERLGRWVERGGRLALLARSGKYALEDGRPEYPLLTRLYRPEKQAGDIETWTRGRGAVMRVTKDLDLGTAEGIRVLAQLMEWLRVERPVTATTGVLASVSRGAGGVLYVTLLWPNTEPTAGTFSLHRDLPGARYRMTNLFAESEQPVDVDRRALTGGVPVSFAANELKVLKLTPRTK